MARVNDLTGENVSRKRRKDRQYGTKTDLSSTTVERGDTHWTNSSRVSIDGVLDVTGLTTISGTLNVSGTTTLSGSTTIAGPTGITGALTIAGSMDVTGPSTFSGTLGIDGATTITGQLDVTGPTTLDGQLDIGGNTTVTGDLNVDGPLDVTGDTTLGGATDITGPTTLKNDLTVDQGRRITLGGLVIENQGAGSAQVQMPGGGISASSALGMSIVHDRIDISSLTNTKIAAGPNSIEVTTNGIAVVAPFISVTGYVLAARARLSGVSAATNQPNMYMDSNGWIYRTSWTP